MLSNVFVFYILSYLRVVKNRTLCTTFNEPITSLASQNNNIVEPLHIFIITGRKNEVTAQMSDGPCYCIKRS